MEFDEQYKEVYFNHYCKLCKYKDLNESEDPCCECLESPARLYSHKPVNFRREKETKKNEKGNN